ncbi:class I SAM-dependent methyltransferase [uncultured Rhodoblastus sp.]|uniref:class I SAM-dependent methyltransferase n=1 Tax=uncultured Rhodoblastus sp. TaxID=543037 RepID=UPI0025CC164A|nr:class I SAM-dependent methyltransferase [uncultured Rhodoblastus sp.]
MENENLEYSNQILKILDALVERKFCDLLGLNDTRFDGADLGKIARIAAGVDSANFAASEFNDLPTFTDHLALLAYAMGQRKLEGLILEFGVFSGQTINFLASLTTQRIYGFDSFEGLPEDWRPDFPKGCFRRDLPEVGDNVELVVGWFDQALPTFLANHSEKASLIHVDCDLYSSTKIIFDLCQDRIAAGTIIVFDEFFNYVGWRRHEYKAFMELIATKDLRFKYIGYVPRHQQVAVEIL